MSKEEKLVEEIGLIDELDAILAMYQFKSTRYVPVAGWWHLITRIGKAYADGELELPGEVGRIIYDGIKEGQRLEDLGFKMGDILIALSGTDKEEE